jgi:hypothetical protein
MSDSDPTKRALREKAERARPFAGTAAPKGKRSLSMHDGVAVWCDCCSCEAEPYWVAVAHEMGVDLGSDYEDDGRAGATPERDE